MNVDFSAVTRLYPNYEILGIEEFFINGSGWTGLFEGKHIRTNDRTLSQQVRIAYDLGATSVNMELKSISTNKCLNTDYRLDELCKEL